MQLSSIQDIDAIYTYASQRVTWDVPSPRNCHILSYQVSGRYEHEVNGRVITVSEGDVFFINRHDAYSVKCREKGYAICVNIIGNATLPTRTWATRDNPQIYPLFLRLSQIKSVLVESNYYLALSLIYEIMASLTTGEEKKTETTTAMQKIERAKAYICEQFADEKITLTHLADMCNMSEKHFRTLFKRKYNATPSEYVTNVRMESAAKLLSEGNLSVSEVAYMVGMQDIYYFSLVFKKRFGVSPSRFKKN